MSSALELTDAAAFTAFVFGEMKSAGAVAGIGRYDEARLWYRGQQYSREGNDGPDWRTVHLGMDVFLEAGSPVFAPLDGAVHSFRNNSLPLDYGPTIILRHDIVGVSFLTLYGHLSAESLEGLREGAPVRRGQRIGSLGDSRVNGGWPPHLHFQVIADLLGRQGDYPGVATVAERDIWPSLCPDPNLILQIPPERFPNPARTSEEIFASRQRHLGP
ncbi:MAG: peptidoglycan DD-metalloendopeptidase family protein [Chloroflexi bacterium]|nr:peptidoglycan DD-metalloendopeptidase family protein [Chloroflexota bacterium]